MTYTKYGRRAAILELDWRSSRATWRKKKEEKRRRKEEGEAGVSRASSHGPVSPGSSSADGPGDLLVVLQQVLRQRLHRGGDWVSTGVSTGVNGETHEGHRDATRTNKKRDVSAAQCKTRLLREEESVNNEEQQRRTRTCEPRRHVVAQLRARTLRHEFDGVPGDLREAPLVPVRHAGPVGTHLLQDDSKQTHFRFAERPVGPDLLALATLQLLQADGQRQQQVAEVKALWATASSGGVARGEADGGEEEEEDESGEEEAKREVGEGEPELPGTLLGRPCWKRQRVPYRQKPKELKVRHRAPRGFHSLACGRGRGLGTGSGGSSAAAAGDSEPLPTTSPASTCRKLQRVPKGQTPKERKGGPLLGAAVHEQAAAAVEAVARRVEAAAQLRLVLGVAAGNVELVEAVGELAALGILAETGGGVAGAQLRLVAGGADAVDEGRGGGLHEGEQGLGQGESRTAEVPVRVVTGQQVVHQLLVLEPRRVKPNTGCSEAFPVFSSAGGHRSSPTRWAEERGAEEVAGCNLQPRR
ncbi:hypothetical protein EYF80_042308 [Liparis tanakae]|uniref:Uncharacterized protein n=1 Tax=Liparis tanakae TaxID=230148 RepID=A0A4Z2G1P9_9TELE|nr:hypothetical protein EYF80_042308 [Liparis tanakae]